MGRMCARLLFRSYIYQIKFKKVKILKRGMKMNTRFEPDQPGKGN